MGILFSKKDLDKLDESIDSFLFYNAIYCHGTFRLKIRYKIFLKNKS